MFWHRMAQYLMGQRYDFLDLQATVWMVIYIIQWDDSLTGVFTGIACWVAFAVLKHHVRNFMGVR